MNTAKQMMIANYLTLYEIYRHKVTSSKSIDKAYDYMNISTKYLEKALIMLKEEEEETEGVEF